MCGKNSRFGKELTQCRINYWRKNLSMKDTNKRVYMQMES